MLEKLRSILKLKELRKKIFFTFLMLVVCRIGAYITIPGINGEMIVNSFNAAVGGGQNVFQLADVFTGGALSKMTVVALGVMPYITASIAVQLLMALFPAFQKEIKENGESGKRKLGKITRYLTLFLAFTQSFVYAKQAIGFNNATPGVIFSDFLEINYLGVPWLFYLITVLTMTTGSLFLMWIGEQITEKGIGNGVSIIISLGILSSLPRSLGNILTSLNIDSQEQGQLSITSLAVMLIVFISVIIGIIMVIQGVRKIAIQYARRTVDTVGRAKKNTPFIPLKINFAGIIPVIFASTFLMFPATIAQFVKLNIMTKLMDYIAYGSIGYILMFSTLIVLFTFVWTSMQFRPDEIASDMKKTGAFIPGVRQGMLTERYISDSMQRITWIGALSLAFIAVLPTIVANILSVDQSVSQFFGGTSILIIVGVILDTKKQIDSHLIMQKYDGFMSSGKKTGKF